MKEYGGESNTRRLLQDFVTTEMLLEVYLRESGMPTHIIGEILEQRDSLLRSLVHDHSYSLKTIAEKLRDSAADEHELEINLVVAARALGFTAKHISGSDNPDGIARYMDFPNGIKKITLEAKSSEDTPSLQAISFGDLRRHIEVEKASGCLLVSPSYPGSSKGNQSAASKNAKQQKISCWTVETLARFVEAAEARHLNAKHLLHIVENIFTPDDVAAAIDKLLVEPSWENTLLYQAIIEVLEQFEDVLHERTRNIDMIAYSIAEQDRFKGIEFNDIEKAIRELAAASQGGMVFREDSSIHINVVLEELKRRVANLAKLETESRRKSSFNKNDQE